MALNVFRNKGLRQSLGPSLLWAGAAIGVSHLIQATRAGAGYEFTLVWVIVLVLVFKYPFFEFGPRYAAATGESLLMGYKRLGGWALGIFVVITLATMFTIVAAVTLVTASLVESVLGSVLDQSLVTWSAMLLGVIGIILAFGRYSLLDRLTKLIIVLLSVSTIIAVVAALLHGSSAQPDFHPPELFTRAGIAFMVVLMGWMPSPIDLSVWNSLWTLERRKQTGHAPRVSEALFDFNLAYIITGVLALCFLTLGAVVMYGTGEELMGAGTKFAGQFVRLYTQTLGSWSYPVIIVAAISTMFSTTLTCTDAYPRVLRRSLEILVPSLDRGEQSRLQYLVALIAVIAGAVVLLTALHKGMRFMIELATTMSFLAAPILAYLNYRVVTSPHMPPEAVPPPWLRALGIGGLAFLTGFALFFLWSFFFWS